VANNSNSTTIAKGDSSVIERMERVEGLADGISDVLADRKRVIGERDSVRQRLKKAEGRLAISELDLRKTKKLLKAALEAKDSPVFVATDEEMLLKRQAVLRFTHRPSGTCSVTMSLRGGRRVIARGDTSKSSTDLFREVMANARKQERGR